MQVVRVFPGDARPRQSIPLRWWELTLLRLEARVELEEARSGVAQGLGQGALALLRLEPAQPLPAEQQRAL
jgi:hypothetical protein